MRVLGSLTRSQRTAGAIATPAAGTVTEFSPDGKSLWLKAPDGSTILVGPAVLPGAPSPGDNGFLAWTYDPAMQGGGQLVPTAGQMHLVKLYNKRATPITVSALWVYVNTVGASLTNVGFALYDTTAAVPLLTSSVNANGATAAAFTTGGTGPKQVTFTTPQTVAAGGSIYGAFWFAGTTMPTLQRTSGLSALHNVNLASPALRYATSGTGLTNTAPAAAATQAGGASAWWMAAA